MVFSSQISAFYYNHKHNFCSLFGLIKSCCMRMDNYAGGKVPASPFLPQFTQYFHYDGVDQLNRLNVYGVSMNPSPVSEIKYCDYEPKKKKLVKKLSKMCFLFYFLSLSRTSPKKLRHVVSY